MSTIDLDSLVWCPRYATAGQFPLDYTPKYCVDCGKKLRLREKVLRKSLWKFDPKTGEENTDTFIEYQLYCPGKCGKYNEYSFYATRVKE